MTFPGRRDASVPHVGAIDRQSVLKGARSIPLPKRHAVWGARP